MVVSQLVDRHVVLQVRTSVGGDLSFITDWRRMNVALTRARYGVVVVGHAVALCQAPIWYESPLGKEKGGNKLEIVQSKCSQPSPTIVICLTQIGGDLGFK